MYITQNLNEKLKVPVMWKLSTAFFPCSKEAFTRPPGPRAGSSITAVWHSALLLCRVSLLGSREWSQGWSQPDQSWSPGWKGATPQAWEWGDTGTCCATVATVTGSLCCAFAVSRPAAARLLGQKWARCIGGVRGSLLLWHFLTEPGSTCQDPALAWHQSHCRSMPHAPKVQRVLWFR